MKAIVRTQYGPPDVVHFVDVAAPTPADDEVMIRLCAASVNPLDLYMMKGLPWNRIPGLHTPKHKILGCDIAGVVTAVGSKVKQFQVGDEVFGATGFEGKGFAEYVCISEKTLGPKAPSLSFEEAAALPVAATTALQGLRDKGLIQPGQKLSLKAHLGVSAPMRYKSPKRLGRKSPQCPAVGT